MIDALRTIVFRRSPASIASLVIGALPPSPCAWACVATILSSARRVSAFDAAAAIAAAELAAYRSFVAPYRCL